MEIKFAENLKNLRKEKGITQKQLADALGVDQRTVSAWENCICEPSFSVLLNICQFFNETFDDLLI